MSKKILNNNTVNLNTLVNKLEDSDIKVNTKELDHNRCTNLKLTSEDALDVIVNKLVELSKEEIVISTNSVIDGNSYDIYVEIND